MRHFARELWRNSRANSQERPMFSNAKVFDDWIIALITFICRTYLANMHLHDLDDNLSFS